MTAPQIPMSADACVAVAIALAGAYLLGLGALFVAVRVASIAWNGAAVVRMRRPR